MVEGRPSASPGFVHKVPKETRRHLIDYVGGGEGNSLVLPWGSSGRKRREERAPRKDQWRRKIGSPFWNRMPVTGSQSVPSLLSSLSSHNQSIICNLVCDE